MQKCQFQFCKRGAFRIYGILNQLPQMLVFCLQFANSLLIDICLLSPYNTLSRINTRPGFCHKALFAERTYDIRFQHDILRATISRRKNDSVADVNVITKKIFQISFTAFSLVALMFLSSRTSPNFTSIVCLIKMHAKSVPP